MTRLRCCTNRLSKRCVAGLAALVLIGRAVTRATTPSLALTTLPPFPRQDPDNASVLSNFANFMFKCRSKPDAAKELYLRALRADTNHKMAARN